MIKERTPLERKNRKSIAEYLHIFRSYREIFPKHEWKWQYREFQKFPHYSKRECISNLHDWMIDDFRIGPEERLRTIYSIMNRIYMARRITMNQKAIVEALDDLDYITNAMQNDHNGECNEYDMLLQEHNAFRKYLT